MTAYMNHEKAKEVLSDFREGELSDEEKDALVLHLAVCGECRRILAEFKQTGNAFFPVLPKPDEFETQAFVQRVMGGIPEEQALIPLKRLIPALGFSFAVFLLSFMPLTKDSAVEDFWAENSVPGGGQELISELNSQSPEEMLGYIMEEK